MSQNVVITVAVNFFVIEMSRSQSITQEHGQCLCIGAIIFYNAPWPSVQRKSKVVSIKQENTSNLWKKWFSPIQFFLLKIDIMYYKSVRFYQNIERASFTESPLISTYFRQHTEQTACSPALTLKLLYTATSSQLPAPVIFTHWQCHTRFCCYCFISLTPAPGNASFVIVVLQCIYNHFGAEEMIGVMLCCRIVSHFYNRGCEQTYAKLQR